MITLESINESALRLGLMRKAPGGKLVVPVGKARKVEDFARWVERATREDLGIGPLTDWILPGETREDAAARRTREAIARNDTREARILEAEDRVQAMRRAVLVMLQQVMAYDPTLLDVFEPAVAERLRRDIAELPRCYWLELVFPAVRAAHGEPINGRVLQEGSERK